MNKTNKIKNYFLSIIVLAIGFTIYFNIKNENPIDVSKIQSSEKIKVQQTKQDVKTEYETQATTKNIKNIKKITQSFDEIYYSKMENYLEEDTVLEDDDGTQWRSLKREWLLNLESFLEEKIGSKKEAQMIILKYFTINQEYQKNKAMTELYKKYDVAVKEYIDLNRHGNISKEEKMRVTKRYRDLEIKLKDSREKLLNQKKKLFGKYYNEVLKELEKYNNEITAKHSHLGYSIGFGL